MLLLSFACVEAEPSETGDSAGPLETGDSALIDPCIELGADDPCCRDPIDTLWACSDDLPSNTPVSGTFTLLTSDREKQSWSLTGADTSYAVDLYAEGGGFSLVPDLATLGTVTVVDDGGCGSDGEGANPGTFSVTDADGAPLFVVGSEGTASLGDLAVAWDELNDTCPYRPSDGCMELLKNHSATFMYGADAVTLYQGESGAFGTLTAYQLMAMQGGGENGCDDFGGQMENWVVVRR